MPAIAALYLLLVATTAWAAPTAAIVTPDGETIVTLPRQAMWPALGFSADGHLGGLLHATKLEESHMPRYVTVDVAGKTRGELGRVRGMDGELLVSAGVVLLDAWERPRIALEGDHAVLLDENGATFARVEATKKRPLVVRDAKNQPIAIADGSCVRLEDRKGKDLAALCAGAEGPTIRAGAFVLAGGKEITGVPAEATLKLQFFDKKGSTRPLPVVASTAPAIADFPETGKFDWQKVETAKEVGIKLKRK